MQVVASLAASKFNNIPIVPNAQQYSIDPLRVTSRGARGEPHWRTTGAVFYGENVQRQCLQLKSADIRFAIFLQLQYVGPSMACFEISLSWLEPRYSHGVKARFSAH